MCEIDTDKIAGELESTWTGVVRALVVGVNESVPVGGTIALVAPAEVPQEDIDAVVAEARAQLESGAIEDVSGPKVLTVDIEGRQLSYAVLGDTESGNDPVLFVHGYGGDKNSWLFVQEPIAADRATYALDLPGHGASSKDVGDGTIQTLAQAVLGFLDTVGLNRVHLVGHSMGGAVITLLAADPAAAGKVASLTLISPVGFGPEINAGYLRGFAEAESRRDLKPHLLALFADPGLVNRQLIDDLLKYKRLDGVDQALRSLVQNLVEGDKSAVDLTGGTGLFRGTRRCGLGPRRQDRACRERSRSRQCGHGAHRRRRWDTWRTWRSRRRLSPRSEKHSVREVLRVQMTAAPAGAQDRTEAAMPAY